MDEMNLFLNFRDSNGKLENFKLRFKILDNNLARSWVDLLISNFFYNNHPIEKNNCLKGWVNSWESNNKRNLDFLCESMNNCIKQVNLELNPKGYFINLSFSKEKLQTTEYRILMNKIHHHFEELIGQTWNTSHWYINSSDTTKLAIEQINNICHEIENTIDSINLYPLNNCYVFASLMGKDFDGKYMNNKIRNELSLDNLTSFSDFSRWGDVNIYYAQLGKRHIEVYRDQDEEIDFNNISGYRYLTGEFVVSFSAGSYFNDVRLPDDFFIWLEKNGFDKSDHNLAIGFPRVAELILDRSKKEISKELMLRDDLYQIGIEDNNKVLYLKTYDFFCQDIDPIRLL